MGKRIWPGVVAVLILLFVCSAANAVPQQPACVQSVGSNWVNQPLPQQGGRFTASFDATPSQSRTDALVGFTLNAANQFEDLATVVRFNTRGMIDVRNGSAYNSDTQMRYASGQTYHVRMVVNPAVQLYDVFVTPPGQSEIALASNYSFRTEQSSASVLNNWTLTAVSGAVSVCGMDIEADVPAPEITSQPADQTVTAGQPATFSVSATGMGSLSYQWQANGADIGGANASSFTISAAAVTDSGKQFAVVVSNAGGQVASNSAMLTVNPLPVAPTITTQPTGQTVDAGDTASFSVVVTGSAPLRFQWRRNGTSISGATSASYTTPVTNMLDNGVQFSVVVSNAAGNVTSSSASLTVNDPSGCPCMLWTSRDTPDMLDAGPDRSVELGLAFRSDVSGFVTGVRFYKSSANIGPHTGSLWSNSGTLLATTTFDSESNSGWQQATFDSPVAIAANITYVISYHASAGHYSVDENYFSQGGVDRAPLHALASGNGVVNGPFTYADTTSFPTNNFQSTNYWVDLVFTSAASRGPTTPAAAPTITSQPSSQTVAGGLTASFSVAATGSAPLSFQWRRNGVNIGGANASSYTTPPTTASDSGARFSVVVSNPAGSVTSSDATLTVSVTTRLLTANPSSLVFGSISISGSSRLTSTVTNTGNSVVTISNVSMAGAGLSVNGISSGQMLQPGQSATLNVNYSPPLLGILAGNIAISSNATNSPTTISVSGLGIQLLSHSATLTWSASASDVVGYNVYSGPASGGPYLRLTPSPTRSLSYKDSTVQSRQTYFYVVTAVDSDSQESDFSNEVSAKIP